MCVAGTNLSVSARALRASFVCKHFQATREGVFCTRDVSVLPVLCNADEAFEITVRDQGMFGAGLIGSLLCEEVRQKGLARDNG